MEKSLNEKTAKVEQIVRRLESLDPSAVEESILDTLNKGDELEELARLTIDKSFKIRYFVIRHLGKFHFESTIRTLTECLIEDNPILRSEAERAIDDVESDIKYDYLMPLLKSPHLPACLYAIKALGKGERVNATLPLLEIISHESPEVRQAVIDALRLIDDARADGPVISLLGDKEPEVRFAAAYYCGSRGIRESCDLLIELLHDKSPSLRLTAAWAIGQIGEKKYIEMLIPMLRDEKSDNVKNEILRCLRQSGLLHLVTPEGVEEQCIRCGGYARSIYDWSRAITSGETLKEADICLFVEGSYPYVAGGVSSWVRDLLSYFSDLTFSIVHITTFESEMRVLKYEIPRNVIYMSEICIYDMPATPGRPGNQEKLSHLFSDIYDFITGIDSRKAGEFEQLYRRLGLPDNLGISIEDIFYSQESWDLLNRLYDNYLKDIPYLEYNWSFRSIILPIYNILRAKFPPARLNYAALTGYAGLAASLGKMGRQTPLMLTEHGIYHRERMLEINSSSWIYEREEEGYIASDVQRGLKKVWIQIYKTLSSIAYLFSDRITTLYGENAEIQIEGGASRDHIRIIPNGIDISELSRIRVERSKKDVFTVATIGRIVPIKDMKTFIRAIRQVKDEMGAGVRFLSLGSCDEDVGYCDECLALIRMLGLEDVYKFTGVVSVKDYLQDIDIVVFTSVSEGQPISMMEAMAAGVPCVATNVGSCKQLLYGGNEEDQSLGRCGIITSVHSPHETASAVLTILNDAIMYGQMSNAARERISRYYRRDHVFELYRKEFQELLNKT